MDSVAYTGRVLDKSQLTCFISREEGVRFAINLLLSIQTNSLVLEVNTALICPSESQLASDSDGFTLVSLFLPIVGRGKNKHPEPGVRLVALLYCTVSASLDSVPFSLSPLHSLPHWFLCSSLHTFTCVCTHTCVFVDHACCL